MADTGRRRGPGRLTAEGRDSLRRIGADIGRRGNRSPLERSGRRFAALAPAARERTETVYP